MPAKKSSKKKSSDMSTLDAGGGSYGLIDGLSGRNDPGNALSFAGAMRPDIRGAYGPGKYDFPDPIQRPREKIRVVQLPGKTVYVPYPVQPKKKKRGAGGGDAAGVQ